jgi:kynurenine 3-monooxygenase
MTQRITIIGGGLSGSLLAIYMAKRGFEVNLFERRPDMRKASIYQGRSINLALSTPMSYACSTMTLPWPMMSGA